MAVRPLSTLTNHPNQPPNLDDEKPKPLRLQSNKLPSLDGRKAKIPKGCIQKFIAPNVQTESAHAVGMNHLHKVPKAPADAFIAPFLNVNELACLQIVSRTTAKFCDATGILTRYELTPLIERYCHHKIGKEKETIKDLHELISFVSELSQLEKIEPPRLYGAIKDFFAFVEAKNLLRMMAEMQKEHPLPNFSIFSLKIEGAIDEILKRAAEVREWLEQNSAVLMEFDKLQLMSRELTLLPSEIGKFERLVKLRIERLCLMSLPKEIGKLRRLQEIWATNNRLASLPAEIGQLKWLYWLDFSNNRLNRLSREIGQLRRLGYLLVNGNQLIKLPIEIGRLANLDTLNVCNNQLTSLPIEVGKLKKLRQLYLNHNRLTSIPKAIGRLRGLRQILLCHNFIQRLPKEIGQLSILEELTLSHNALTQLPKEVGSLGKLKQFWVSNNQLSSVPKEIGQLVALEELNLEYNQLLYIPCEISLLPLLNRLYLSNNLLNAIPKGIGQLKTLAHLDLDSNCLKEIPEEISQLGDSPAFRLLVRENGLIDLPLGLRSYNQQLEKQNKKLQTITFLKRLSSCLTRWHDCDRLAFLLDQMEKLIGPEIRTKLEGCLYRVCKKKKALYENLRDLEFRRGAFANPHIRPKRKLAAISIFSRQLQKN